MRSQIKYKKSNQIKFNIKNIKRTKNIVKYFVDVVDLVK